MDRRTIATVMLGIGAFVGVAMAGFGLLDRTPALDDETVARVNDVSISRAKLDEYVTLVNQGSKTEKDARFVLSRMIDEELLVQRAMELGLIEQDSTIRNTIVQAVTRRFATTTDTGPVPEAVLAEFYEANLDYFTSSPDFTVAVLMPEGFPLPNKPLSQKALRQYLGAGVADRVTALHVGETSESMIANGQTFRVQLVAKREGTAPPLAEIHDTVLTEFRRREGERAFADYLAFLRERASIKSRLAGGGK